MQQLLYLYPAVIYVLSPINHLMYQRFYITIIKTCLNLQISNIQYIYNLYMSIQFHITKNLDLDN